MASALSAATTLAIVAVTSARSAKKAFAETMTSAQIVATKSTKMSELSSSALRIAFTAVRMQRITADKREAWLDDKMREEYVTAEAALEVELRKADEAKEIASRGGKKLKTV
jgi:hypothetical protein